MAKNREIAKVSLAKVSTIKVLKLMSVSIMSLLKDVPTVNTNQCLNFCSIFKHIFCPFSIHLVSECRTGMKHIGKH